MNFILPVYPFLCFMKAIEIDPNNMLAAAAAIPENTPVLMLNLLRFKEQATYEKEMPPCSGYEAYMQGYVPEFSKIATDAGFKPFFLGTPLANLVVPANETWDFVGLIEYPNFAAFRSVIESPAYKANALHHRLAALEDWRLIVTVKADIS